MKLLWLGRLSRPDLIKPIGDLATQIQKWTRNCDKQLYRLVCYLHSSTHLCLQGSVDDPTGKLELRLFVDADFAGDRQDVKSTSGGYLALVGPRSFFPLAWVSKKQTSVSRSTTEAEVVSLAHSLMLEALPMLSALEFILGRSVRLAVLEDNEATIKVVQKGYSPKLRHCSRTHRVNLASLKEQFDQENILLEYVGTLEQAADIFTKALEPAKSEAALRMLGVVAFSGTGGSSKFRGAPHPPQQQQQQQQQPQL